MYRTADVDAHGVQDQWIAISVADDTQWQALCRVTDRGGWAADPALATTVGRRGIEDELDAGSRTGTRPAPPRRSSRRCRPPAYRPSQWYRHTSTTGWRRWGGGACSNRSSTRSPARPLHRHAVRHANGPRVHNRRHAPLLGEHNRDVFTRILGLTGDEVDTLTADGVIGDAVVGGVLH